MTVTDLIESLRACNPHANVKVLMAEVWDFGPGGEKCITLDSSDAVDAGVVRNEGVFVVIESK